MVSLGEVIAISTSSSTLPRLDSKLRANGCTYSLAISSTQPLPLTAHLYLSPNSIGPTDLNADVAGDSVDVVPDSGGDDFGGPGKGGSGGGGNRNEGEGEPDESEDKSKKTRMSMSQKLTLIYAVLVGIGGLRGYLKSGSQKSLMAGGFSALLSYYVYTQLRSKMVFASAIGLSISVALLRVMIRRVKNSDMGFWAVFLGIKCFVLSLHQKY